MKTTRADEFEAQLRGLLDTHQAIVCVMNMQIRQLQIENARLTLKVQLHESMKEGRVQ